MHFYRSYFIWIGCIMVLMAHVIGCSAEAGNQERTFPANPGPQNALPQAGETQTESSDISVAEAAGTDTPFVPLIVPTDYNDYNDCNVQPTVLFVVDGSGSMCEPFGGVTRWQALRTALLHREEGVIYLFQDQASFGMLLYDGTISMEIAMGAIDPNAPQSSMCAAMYMMNKQEGECPQLIQVPPALNNAKAIDGKYPNTELGGSTPTDKAMNVAISQLLDARGPAFNYELTPQYIILATDGRPNDICIGGAGGDGLAQQQGVISEVDRAAQENITTFVISLAGGDAALEAHLDEVALHGDPANSEAQTYSPESPAALVETLDELLDRAFSCVY